MRFVDLGLISFQEAFALQEETVRAIAQCRATETVYLLEHPHVFTGGRSGHPENLLTKKDWDGHPIEMLDINRGGDVTYHGPGQLVGYPHLDLRNRGRDVHEYLRGLEEVLLRTAAEFGIGGHRRAGYTGVWTEHGKLASIGVGVRQWVTMHGFALNVNTDLRYFQLINPCGIVGCTMVSLASLLGKPIDMAEVKQVVTEKLTEVFV